MIKVKIPFRGLIPGNIWVFDSEIELIKGKLPEGSAIDPEDYVSWKESHRALIKVYVKEWLKRKKLRGEISGVISYSGLISEVYVDINSEDLQLLAGNHHNAVDYEMVLETTEPVGLRNNILGHLKDTGKIQECLVFDWDSYKSAIAKEALDLADKMKELKGVREALIEILKDDLGGLEISVTGDGYKLTKSTRTSTAYKSAVEHYAPDADLSPFQTESTVYTLRRAK